MANNNKPSKPTQPANGPANKPPYPYGFLFILLALFLLITGIGYALLMAGQSLAGMVFIALAPAVPLFGFLKSTAAVKIRRLGQFGGAAGLFMAVFGC